MVHFTKEDIWGHGREEKNTRKCAEIGENSEKCRQYALISTYRRVWDAEVEVYSAEVRISEVICSVVNLSDQAMQLYLPVSECGKRQYQMACDDGEIEA